MLPSAWMKHYMYLAILVICQLACGQNFDPPPLNPDPLSNEGLTHRPHTARPSGGAVISGTTTSSANGRFRSQPVPRERTRVAVLGYHNFSATRPVSDMLLRTSELRAQMEKIRREGITVISMREFLEWRFGNLQLPEKCVLITLDDGWRSVYTDAYPIFREYGYPFHLFLYTRYLTGRGDSMSPEMVRNMMANGASVGSHSVSHPYPSTWRRHQNAGQQAYHAFIDREFGDSRRYLEQHFGQVNTYCYPGGYNDEAMVSRLPLHGYVAAFTVIPGKVTCEVDPLRIDRYMVFGTDHSIFRRAIDFGTQDASSRPSSSAQPGRVAASAPPPPFPVSPKPQSCVPSDVPTITAQLSGLSGINLSTVRMEVSGFGRVPAKLDAASRSLQWTPPCRIYMPNLSVHVYWDSTDGTHHRAEWSFSIDQTVTIDQ